MQGTASVLANDPFRRIPQPDEVREWEIFTAAKTHTYGFAATRYGVSEARVKRIVRNIDEIGRPRKWHGEGAR